MFHTQKKKKKKSETTKLTVGTSNAYSHKVMTFWERKTKSAQFWVVVTLKMTLTSLLTSTDDRDGHKTALHQQCHHTLARVSINLCRKYKFKAEKEQIAYKWHYWRKKKRKKKPPKWIQYANSRQVTLLGHPVDTDWQISAWVKVFISKTTEIS